VIRPMIGQPLFSIAVITLGLEAVLRTIGTDGVPRQLRFVSGDTRLSAPALDAIRLWRYKPAMLDGQAIETEVLVQVEFKLRS